MAPTAETLLGGLEPAAFLRGYWQQKPLLIRQAWPGFASGLDAETLAGLALEPEVESRLIQDTDAGWQLQQGPIAEETFLGLPDQRWTLLVQDVDKLLPELQSVLDAFRFVPDWRLDDLMVSYAATGGSVGAHVDQYDVFLLQAAGRRRWQIDQRPDAPLEERDDAPLRLLSSFQPSDTWVLDPGDMLYLPPGIPHHGVALEPCLTFSIGFRAPTERELLGELMQFLLEDDSAPAFFADAGRAPSTHPAQLDGDSLRRGRELIRNRLTRLDDALLNRVFGRTVTLGKTGFRERTPESQLDHARLTAHLDTDGALIRHPALRIALLDAPHGGWCFIEGEEYRLTPDMHAMLRQLTVRRTVTGTELAHWRQLPACMDLLLNLLNQGHWELTDEWHE